MPSFVIYLEWFYKEANLKKNVGGVIILVLNILSDDALICTKFHENIIDNLKVIE